ncbi:MAG: signal peptidase I [Acidimicrobiaceae bacterium]|nr:signal peptidase I [Acidimicrobiaceae bacterium]
MALGASAVVVLGLFWINFAPPRLGGDSVYVVTSGISMEPRFHTGDLAILRPASSYRVGEIVGYRSPVLGIVMHRIIGESNGHFFMKGDNNNFVDTYHPTPSDVVGRLWLHVPKIGRLINNRQDRLASVAVATVAMAGVVGVPAERERRRRQKSRRRSEESPSGNGGHVPPPPHAGDNGLVAAVLGAPGQIAASVIIVIALAALTLAAFSFSRSTTTVTPQHLQYQQVGTWSYHAVTKGDVYANGVARTGQPLYFAVAPVATVNFFYKFNSVLPTNLTGRAGLTAVLSSSDGWSHSFKLGPTIPIAGTSAKLSGTLNLPTIENYLSTFKAQTNQSLGSGVSTYTLSLEPSVHVSGSLGGTSLQPGEFSPPLSFSLLANEAQLNYGQPGSTTTLAQLIQPTSTNSVSVDHTSSAHLSFLGLRPSVSGARNVALWILLACLLALLALGLLLRKAYRTGETERIEARYGSMLVGVERPESLGGVGTMRMANFDDLVKVAQHQGRLILHCDGESGRDYFVRDQSLTYLYSVHEEPKAVPVEHDVEAKISETVASNSRPQVSAIGHD